MIRKHGAFEINREVLGLRPKDQTCHHEVWVHLSHVNARLVDRASGNLHLSPTNKDKLEPTNEKLDTHMIFMTIHASPREYSEPFLATRRTFSFRSLA